MKVFVAGATGAIGRPLVRQLLAAGHRVTGMTRSREKARALEAAGAEAAVCDAFDRDGVAEAMAGARPEAVIHQLTDLPQVYDLRKLEAAYASNDRVRREATPNLIDAARAVGARRLVAQSIAFLYAPVGGWVKDESAPPNVQAPPPFDRSVETMLGVERAIVEAGGLALRYGFFYGPGTYHARDGSISEQVRRRRYPVVGRGRGMFSFVHVEDAAAAAVAALERGAPGVYNVVDDDPAPVREWLPALAEALGAKRPLRVPLLLTKLVAGAQAASFATELRGAANAKAKLELGWEPRYPSWREGFRTALG